MHEVQERIEKMADYLRSHSAEADAAGRLPEETAQKLREAGVMRMLQPKEFGGYEASPAEFFETVLKIGSYCSAAGWISGVVGVHPWEIALFSKQVQREVWGEDPDTWISSPYAPFGRARPVEGGYLFSGRWPFASGTDNCEWAVLDGIVTTPDGEVDDPTRTRHFMIPRADYEIQHDSWDVLGLRGTGSKDLVVKDAFVPEYRIGCPARFQDGSAAKELGRDNPLYAMPLDTMFAGTIACTTLAMADGALDAFIEFTGKRITNKGTRTATDHAHLAVLGEASADIAASRAHYLDGWRRMWDAVSSGRHPLRRPAAGGPPHPGARGTPLGGRRGQAVRAGRRLRLADPPATAADLA